LYCVDAPAKHQAYAAPECLLQHWSALKRKA
jgi:hypothetical protein